MFAQQAQRAHAAQAQGGPSLMLRSQGSAPASPAPAPMAAPARGPLAPSSGYNPADYAGRPTAGNWSHGIERAMRDQQDVGQLAGRR